MEDIEKKNLEDIELESSNSKEMEKENANDVKLNSDDFEFVHDEKEFGKIHDEKFKTKSTTFVKDAFKRFVRNKASVVGAIIIAILMLGSVFVPILSPYSTTKTNDPALKLLPPKLFNAGTGWWDGCKKMTGTLVYDEDTGKLMPGGEGNQFKKPNAVIKGSVKAKSIKYYDYASPNFVGGNLRVEAREPKKYTGSNAYYFREYLGFEMGSSERNINVTISFAETDFSRDGYEEAEYRIRLACKNTKTSKNYSYIELSDWSKAYDVDLTYNLTQAYKDSGLAAMKYCTPCIEFKPSETSYTYIMLDKITYECDDEEFYEETLKHHDIDDANHTALKTTADEGCWVSSGTIAVYQAKYETVTYRYDLYEHALGFTDNYAIGKSLLDEYISKGWCEYDWDIGPTSFKKLSNKCPIIANSDGEFVTGQTKTQYGGQEVWQIQCNVNRYSMLGYKKMPRFIFGTDDLGRACFTHSLRCLKNSLAVSILCCAVTIAIGIIWGSISGYYGGRIDLTMERISDILAGVPSTVVLTLVLILMGRTLTTFAFAVCLTGWIGTASLTRTQMYRFKNRESVLASRTLGANDGRLIFRHILPNALGTIVTSSVLMIPGFIFTEASLAFLHLGLDSGDSFGVLISNNQAYLSTRPLLTFFPAIIISLLMISFNLFGNGLRDALNPTLKGGEQ